MSKLFKLAAYAAGALLLVLAGAVLPVRTANAIGTPPSPPVAPGDPNAMNAVVKVLGGSMNPNSLSAVTLYTVPAGKRLVIETLWGTASGPVGQKVMGSYRIYFAGTTYSAFCAYVDQGDIGGIPRFTYNHNVRLYADAGSKVEFQATCKLASVPYSNYTAGFAGYLVDGK